MIPRGTPAVHRRGAGRGGFVDVEPLAGEGEAVPLPDDGIDDCALYPLFSEEVVTLMRDLIPRSGIVRWPSL